MSDRPTYTFESQKAGIGSVLNMRELGGYVLPDGRVVKKGLLLRGGALSSLSNEDRDLLRSKFTLAADFDFRTEGEIEHAPDRIIAGVKYVWFPTIDPQTEKVADMSLPKEAYKDLPGWLISHASDPLVQSIASRIYTDMVMNEWTQIQYAAFMQSILNTENGAIFWHCSQGKDRTGLGAAFILCALGADRELILQDYLISGEYYKEDVDRLCESLATEAEKDVVRTFVGVNVNYFVAALDLIDRQYGSLENYIKGPLCLTDDDIRVLRERYTE